MRRAQLAINSVSTRHANLEGALEAYAQAGFTLVEFVLPQLKEYIAQGHTLDEVRALLKHHNLRAIGGFEAGINCFGTLEQQRSNHELLQANARLIHDLGGGTMVIGTDGPEQITSDALPIIAERIRDLAVRIEGLQVTIAVEFNWSPIIKSLNSAALVVRQVAHPQVGILFDPAHYYTTATKFEHLNAETVPLIRHVHLNDMRDKPGDLSNCNSDRVLPGQGVLDLRAIIGRLEEFGYQGLYSIEMFNEDLWQLPAAQAARQCYQSLLPLCDD